MVPINFPLTALINIVMPPKAAVTKDLPCESNRDSGVGVVSALIEGYGVHRTAR